jgi:hypothetical protein
MIENDAFLWIETVLNLDVLCCPWKVVLFLCCPGIDDQWCIVKDLGLKYGLLDFGGTGCMGCLETAVFYWLFFVLTNEVNYPCWPWQRGLNKMLLMNRHPFNLWLILTQDIHASWDTRKCGAQCTCCLSASWSFTNSCVSIPTQYFTSYYFFSWNFQWLAYSWYTCEALPSFPHFLSCQVS